MGNQWSALEHTISHTLNIKTLPKAGHETGLGTEVSSLLHNILIQSKTNTALKILMEIKYLVMVLK